MQQPGALCVLPDEILQLVLGGLGPRSRARASATCRRFRRLARVEEIPVDPRGGEHGLPKIGDAVELASAGRVIRVAPGRYRESIVLEKELHIRASPGAVLEKDAWGTPLTCTGPAAPTVRGLALRARGGFHHRAVLLEEGSRALLEACDVSSHGVGIEASRACPTIMRNAIHDCGCGIAFLLGSAGVASGNAIARCSGAGVLVGASARPALEGNVFSSLGVGVRAEAGARPRLRGNRAEGVAAPLEADPLAACDAEAAFESDPLPWLALRAAPD
eukprot:tig00021179_g19287.t1